MNFVLHPHRSCEQSPYRVHANVRTLGAEIHWQVEVVLKDPATAWHTEARYGKDPRKNWELWNFDVVESFLQPRQDADDLLAPYLELQVSPLNQPLAVVILKPRAAFFTPMKLQLEHKVELTAERWRTDVKVVLPDEFKFGQLYGGFFACLGAAPRTYLSTNPNPEDRPDFHRPELFIKL